MPQKQIGSISEIELWQAGILQFKITRKLKKKTPEFLNPRILGHFIRATWEKNRI
jgi:hypothetical protein